MRSRAAGSSSVWPSFIASERPDQRYAAAQVLRLRRQPLAYFREARRPARPQVHRVNPPWFRIPRRVNRAAFAAPQRLAAPVIPWR